MFVFVKSAPLSERSEDTEDSTERHPRGEKVRGREREKEQEV